MVCKVCGFIQSKCKTKTEVLGALLLIPSHVTIRTSKACRPTGILSSMHIELISLAFGWLAHYLFIFNGSLENDIYLAFFHLVINHHCCCFQSPDLSGDHPGDVSSCLSWLLCTQELEFKCSRPQIQDDSLTIQLWRLDVILAYVFLCFPLHWQLMDA